MSERMSHAEYVAGVRTRILECAKRMLRGQVSYCEGSVEISTLHLEAELPAEDDDIAPFLLIASETDDIPVGPVREWWTEEAIAKLGPRMASAERWAREVGGPACASLVRRSMPNLAVNRRRPASISLPTVRRRRLPYLLGALDPSTGSVMPSRRRSRRPPRIAKQAVELSLAAPQVMAHRLARLAFAGSAPSLRDRREFYRMGAEKVAALHESWAAMWLALFRAHLNLALSPFWQWSGHGRRAGLTILGAGLGPFHRRVTANARRLSRTRIT